MNTGPNFGYHTIASSPHRQVQLQDNQRQQIDRACQRRKCDRHLVRYRQRCRRASVDNPIVPVDLVGVRIVPHLNLRLNTRRYRRYLRQVKYAQPQQW